jgi:hypothetical protein
MDKTEFGAALSTLPATDAAGARDRREDVIAQQLAKAKTVPSVRSTRLWDDPAAMRALSDPTPQARDLHRRGLLARGPEPQAAITSITKGKDLAALRARIALLSPPPTGRSACPVDTAEPSVHTRQQRHDRHLQHLSTATATFFLFRKMGSKKNERWGRKRIEWRRECTQNHGTDAFPGKSSTKQKERKPDRLESPQQSSCILFTN